ncbi:MAG: polysaccharide biosynthesis protein [Aggregatilineales bacterium]
MATTQRSFTFRNRYFLLTDVVLFVASAFGSFVLRLETVRVNDYAVGLLWFTAISLIVKLSLFVAGGVYSRYWKSAGPTELILLGRICLLAGIAVFGLVFAVTMIVPYSQIPLPRSVAIIDFLLSTLLVITTRFSLRASNHLQTHRRHNSSAAPTGKRTVIIGAGQMGILVFDTLGTKLASINVVGFLDDDVNKAGTYVRGLKVLGRIADLPELANRMSIKFVIIAMPSAPGSVIRKVTQTCQQIGIEHQIVPSLLELAIGKISVNTLRPVAIDDLLRRAPTRFDLADIEARLRGQRVLVTGAGGSIGSELSWQIARCQPESLLLLGRDENSLFMVEQRLKRDFPSVRCHIVLVDVQDLPRLIRCFERWQPSIVFHAAAHKHVPILEANIGAAILNNIAATQNVIELCTRFNVSRLIFISSDKAVQPTSVMGMSKRVAELMMIHAALDQPNRFATVRFGNVLGSQGSVVPIFQQQIALGGPLMVTDPQMARFFMSVSEAVLLVLQASILTDCGPLFVLNMGEPVRIVDLAHDLIKLSGFEPGRDIEVKITGVRPGEKLFEELFWNFEEYHPVAEGNIFALDLSKDQHQLIATKLPNMVRTMIQSVADASDDQLRQLLSEAAFLAS